MTPLRELVRPSVDEARLQRNWRAIQSRRAGRRSRRAPTLAGFGLVALATASLVLFVLRGSEPVPLATREGGLWTAIEGPVTELSDGSRIEVERGSDLQLIESSARSVELVLRGGGARFSITPGGPRRWAVEAGGVRVEVLGTRFLVRSEERGVTVEVEHGAVIVRARSLRDGLQRISAGERAFIARERRVPTATVEPTPTASSALPSAPEPASHTAPDVQPAQSAGALIERADAALPDRPELAARLLREVLREHPRDPRAPVAAITLGRIELLRLERPARAAHAFAWALARGVPAGIDEDVRALHVEALSRAGRADEARAAADALLDRHPEGQRARAARRWVE